MPPLSFRSLILQSFVPLSVILAPFGGFIMYDGLTLESHTHTHTHTQTNISMEPQKVWPLGGKHVTGSNSDTVCGERCSKFHPKRPSPVHYICSDLNELKPLHN